MNQKLVIAVLISPFLSTCAGTSPIQATAQAPDGYTSHQMRSEEYDQRHVQPQGTRQVDDRSSEFLTYQPEDLSQSVGGITVQISEITYSPLGITLHLRVFADARFGVAYVSPVLPQISYLGDLLLTDREGHQLRRTSGEYGFASAAPSGGVVFQHVYGFEATPPGVASLDLEIPSISLENIQARDPVEIRLEGLDVGDEWQLNQAVDIGPTTVILGSARLLEANDPNHSFRIELAYAAEEEQFEGATIRVGCPMMFRTLRPDFEIGAKGCAEGEPVTFFEFGSARYLGIPLVTRPIQYQLIASAIVVDGPWKLSWPVEVEG